MRFYILLLQLNSIEELKDIKLENQVNNNSTINQPNPNQPENNSNQITTEQSGNNHDIATTQAPPPPPPEPAVLTVSKDPRLIGYFRMLKLVNRLLFY